MARWRSLMSGGADRLRLAEAAALIDAIRTGCDPEDTLGRLDAIADGFDGDTFDAVHRRLFDELGFAGDAEDYHHERNSLLSRVIDRRRGMPILLSIVAIDVAARRGVTLSPIGMPGHFLVRHDGDPAVYVDAFDRGTLLDRRGCEALFHRSFGPDRALPAGALDPVGPAEVIARVLANLKSTYTASGDLANLRWVLALRSEVPGVPVVEAFERAAVLDELGGHDEAALVLDPLVAHADDRIATLAEHRARASRARNN